MSRLIEVRLRMPTILLGAILGMSLLITVIRANAQDSADLSLKFTRERSITTAGSPTGIAWARDGQRIAAIYDFGRAISVWKSDGTPLALIKRESTTGPYVGSSLAFMPDRRTIIAPAPTPDRKNISTFGLWDSETGALLKEVPTTSSQKINQAIVANTFALSPDGSLLAVSYIQNLEPIAIDSL